MLYAIIAVVVLVVVIKIDQKKKAKAEEAQRKAEEAAREAQRKAEEEVQKREFEARVEKFQDTLSSLPMPTIVPATPIVTENVEAKFAAVKYSTVTIKTDHAKLSNFVVIDTETTGLSPARNEIIDVAAIRFREWKPVEKFSCRLSPKKHIPPKATKVNGITDEMVAGKPHFNEVAAQLVDFIGKDNLVGQNLPFDLEFILRGGADVTVVKRKYYDTLDIAKHTLKKVKDRWDKEFKCYMPDIEGDYDVDDYKLETLCSYYGIVLVDAHRAENDALATGMLFHELANARMYNASRRI